MKEVSVTEIQTYIRNHPEYKNYSRDRIVSIMSQDKEYQDLNEEQGY